MIRVERSEAQADAQESGAFLASLDAGRGAWLGCDVEAEGLFRRESMGCADPALGFYLDGIELKVLAFMPIGHALLEHVRPLAAFNRCKGGLSVRLAPADSGPHPAIQVLRAFLDLFKPVHPELALFGAFSFDYYRLAGGSGVPDDGRRRVVLFFGTRVLVAKDRQAQWVEFRFPDVEPVADAVPAVLEPVRLDRETDDLPSGGHAKQVEMGLERLRRGELFSLVLSQTFRRRASVLPSAAFQALRTLNPYPAMFFLNLGGGEILFGASPDLQVRADGDKVESAPVCGTFRRGADPIADADQAAALLNSGKEDASLAACADSDRNDKAKVCEPGSLELVSSRRVHFFSTILHTIDHTRGRRRKDADAFDILLAHSTPATVTGLPKPAALSAIEEIESSWRGWYAGAVARLGSDGSMEALTVLRAARIAGDIAEVRTGGNLLVDSDPEKEEEETRLKAETLFRVLSGESPRAPARAVVFDCRFKATLFAGDDPMGSLLAECLESVGCEVVTGIADSIAVLGDGNPVSGWLKEPRPVVAIGTSALALLEAHGGFLTTLAEPRYARRIQALAPESGFMEGCGPMDLGLYARQVIEIKNLPLTWRAVLVSAEGWVLAASAVDRPHVALLCRPDSVQSMKGDAGRRLLHAALAWANGWRNQSGL